MNATTTETRNPGVMGGHGSWAVDGLMSVALVDARMLCISDVDVSGARVLQKKPNEPSARKKKNTLTQKHVVNHRPCVGHLPHKFAQILRSLELNTQLFHVKLGVRPSLATRTWHLAAGMKDRTDEKVLASFPKISLVEIAALSGVTKLPIIEGSKNAHVWHNLRNLPFKTHCLGW